MISNWMSGQNEGCEIVIVQSCLMERMRMIKVEPEDKKKKSKKEEK